ncbi:MAG: ROK family protein [Clostridia bacterium]|nr:ROK family protein [Clostridia bacterium]
MGGMSAKIGAVDNGEIIDRMSVPVEAPDGDALANAIAEACSEMMKKHSVRFVGVGTPGIITGGKIDAANLPFKDYPLGEVLGEKLGLPVKIENDANCAALGETLAGAGRGAQNLLLVTLGTGIGLGIISGGHIYSGRGAAGEAGHMCIEYDGLPCPCGEKGCWEQYASASALIRETKEAAAANPDSILAECAKNEVNGKTVFEAMDKGCETAKAVYDKYLDYLAVGITNLANIFDPEAIIISGGLSNEGARLSEPLCEKLKIKCDIRIASLKNDAGIIGAASLDD